MNEITHRLKTARAEFRNAQRATRCCCTHALAAFFACTLCQARRIQPTSGLHSRHAVMGQCDRVRDKMRGVAWRGVPVQSVRR